MARIAIVGGGSMGEALLSGLLRADRQVKDLVVAEKHPDRAKYLSETYSVLVTSVLDAVEHATYVIVAVKPTDVESVMGDIAEAAAKAEADAAVQAERDERGPYVRITRLPGRRCRPSPGCRRPGCPPDGRTPRRSRWCRPGRPA